MRAAQLRTDKIKKLAFRVGKFSLKSCYWLFIALALMLVAIVLTVKYAVMPSIERYQGDIVSRVAITSGMDVSAKSIRGRWSGFRPWVDMEDVVFREPSDTRRREAGAEALRLPYVSASLSWWALAIGQIRFGEITVDSPALSLSRRADGLIYFAGRALNEPKPTEDDGRLLPWLLEQDGLVVRDATLTWSDEMTPGKDLLFAEVGIAVHKRRNGHEFGFTARPPKSLARSIEARAAVRLENEQGRWIAAGSAYANVLDARLAEIRQHVILPEALIDGAGNVRLWVDFDSNAPAQAVPNAAMRASTPLRAIVADLRLSGAKARLADDLAPLDIADLSGRIEYRAADAGFTVASKGLAFRTRAGVNLAPADFSLTLRDQNDAAKAGGEMTGNGIDLKVMSALLEYFPVGKEVRQVGASYAPRGIVRDMRYAWSGPLEAPAAYQVKGTLADFALAQRDAAPGVRGFTATLDGDQNGGRFDIASKSLALDVPQLYEDPLSFERLDAKGSWKIDADTIEVAIGSLALENADLAGEFSGRYWRHRAGGKRAAEEKGPGSIDLTGKFSRVKATSVSKYLPIGIKPAREYVAWAVRDGEVRDAETILKGTLYDFPFHKGVGGQFRIAGKVKDIVLKHTEGWPQISEIDGEVLFENTHFESVVASAKVFNTRLGRTLIAIDDFAGAPPMLTIAGTTAARAEEASRYLRESPLINTIGGFTRVVALDGPGKLDLDLKIPLGDYEKHRVPTRFSGQYAINRGHAVVSIGDKKAEIQNVTGGVNFSETGTKGGPITGIAFGNPVTVAIAGNGDGGIVTEFAGRAAMEALSDLMPVRLPQQVSGVVDIGGKVIGRQKGVEIQVASSLLGATSTLPFPLAKRADEMRRLTLSFTDTAQSTEKIRLNLAGNAGPQGDLAESRVEAQFKRHVESADASGGFHGGIASVGDPIGDRPIPEGMWLIGTLPRFDFDLWRTAIDNFYPPAKVEIVAARTDPGNGSPIAGFDFKLGSMVAYGRPFKALTLKGRHAGDDWRMAVDSAEAAGDFSWRPASGVDRGYVRARLTRFSLADEVPGAAANPTPQAEADKTELPAFDIVADQFTFKEKLLGKLEFKATPQGANWKIDQLNISNGHAKLVADGLYQRYGDPMKADGRSRTSMNVRLETSNLNALFDQFGYAEYMKGGKGTVEGKLSWPGHSFQFSFPTLSGNMRIAASEGRFAKIEPGAGKLLGLLSLQSLPNRLTLDFRDIYSDGLAFARLESDLAITNGTMHSDNLEIDGPAVYIQMSGDVMLPTEQVMLKAKVLPKFGSNAAIGAGAVLTPVIGLGVFAVSKLLEQALSYDLVISGSWDNPQVTDLRKNAPKVVPPPPAGNKDSEGKGKAP